MWDPHLPGMQCNVTVEDFKDMTLIKDAVKQSAVNLICKFQRVDYTTHNNWFFVMSTMSVCMFVGFMIKCVPGIWMTNLREHRVLKVICVMMLDLYLAANVAVNLRHAAVCNEVNIVNIDKMLKLSWAWWHFAAVAFGFFCWFGLCSAFLIRICCDGRAMLEEIPKAYNVFAENVIDITKIDDCLSKIVMRRTVVMMVVAFVVKHPHITCILKTLIKLPKLFSDVVFFTAFWTGPVLFGGLFVYWLGWKLYIKLELQIVYDSFKSSTTTTAGAGMAIACPANINTCAYIATAKPGATKYEGVSGVPGLLKHFQTHCSVNGSDAKEADMLAALKQNNIADSKDARKMFLEKQLDILGLRTPYDRNRKKAKK